MSSAGDGASPSAGRPSAITPQVKLERRVNLFYMLFFYGFIATAGAIWYVMTRSAQSPALGALYAPRSWLLDAGLGLGAGLVLAGGAKAVTAGWGAARELEREFGWILGEQRAWECVALALLSGFAEELFFRGAMQAQLGAPLATVVFAALHWPVNWSFRLWPFFAAAAGAVLAMERHVTGGLVAPILTHVIVNAVNLTRITRAYRVWRD